MKYFIGVVPPEKYYKQILDFQHRFDNNRFPKLIEPHITVKAQGGLTSDMNWFEGVKRVSQSYTPFKVQIGLPDTFGDSVLFLKVKSNQIYLLHKDLIKTINPTKKLIKEYFELEDYHPHITLGTESHGMTKDELRLMEMKAKKELKPFDFTVDFLRIYVQREINDKYEKLIDIKLYGE